MSEGTREAAVSDAVAPEKRALDPSKLAYRLAAPQEPANPSQTGCTDNMLICHWDESSGWEDPEIRPYGALSIMPTASVLQYATECFEGIKAYRGYDGKLRLFRLQLNCQRMLRSSVRAGLPAFAPAALEELIRAFVALESARWLPSEHKGETLYLRPTHIGTTPGLGLQRPRHSTLYVVATRVSGFKTKGAMTLVTSPLHMVRAWPGGFGNAKLGANYGPTLVAHADAISRGFDQVLWLYGSEEYATEAGASNLFVVWRTRQGELQLVTAGLDNQTILEGITRRSVIELVQYHRNNIEGWKIGGEDLEPLDVVERDFSINEVSDAIEEGRLVEAFASGTAYFIAPIRLIRHRDQDFNIPCGDGATTGHYAALIKGWLGDIVYGHSDFEDWTNVVNETIKA